MERMARRRGTCPRGEDIEAPPELQDLVLLCIVDRARPPGLGPHDLAFLTTTAASKARDIVLCHDFSHEACGKEAFYAADERGYKGPIGETSTSARGRSRRPGLPSTRG